MLISVLRLDIKNMAFSVVFVVLTAVLLIVNGQSALVFDDFENGIKVVSYRMQVLFNLS